MTGTSDTPPVRTSLLGRLDAMALGLVVFMLMGVSFLATWRGLSDFVTAQDETASLASGLVFRALVFVVVLTLTLAMYVCLRELFRSRAMLNRLFALVLYGFLALWSIGFGYGFWWSLIAGHDTSARELQAAVAEVDTAGQSLTARLNAAESAMRSAARLSAQKAETEETRGGTCGLATGAGDGPLYRARMETNAQIAVLADSVATDWAGPLSGELAGLTARPQAALAATEGVSRREQLETAWAEAQSMGRRIAADAESRGGVYAAQLRAKAAQLSQPPEGGSVPYCYDPDLARALTTAADALDQPFTLTLPDWRYAGGQEGVARAIEALWGRIFALLPGGKAGGPAPLDGRSLIALIIAIAVDAALFVFTLFQYNTGGTVGAQRRVPGRVRKRLKQLRGEIAAMQRALAAARAAAEAVPEPAAPAQQPEPRPAPPPGIALTDREWSALEDAIDQLEAQRRKLLSNSEVDQAEAFETISDQIDTLRQLIRDKS